jgi:hypothetical protein
MRHPVVIPNGDEYAAGTHVNRAGREFRSDIEIELFQTFLSLPGSHHSLGDGEYGEKDEHEGDA